MQGLRRRRGVNRGEIRDPTLSALRTGGRKGGAWKSGECVGREGVKGEGAQGGGVALRCVLLLLLLRRPGRACMATPMLSPSLAASLAACCSEFQTSLESSRGRTLSEPRELLLCPVAAAGRELPRRHNSSRWTAWTLIMATPINLQVQLLAVIHTASCTRRNQLPKHRSWQKGKQARAVRYIPGKDGRKL